MAITSGFEMTLDIDGFKIRKWVMKDGVKYWLDDGEDTPEEEPEFGDHCHDCGEDTCCCDLDAQRCKSPETKERQRLRNPSEFALLYAIFEE